MRFLRISIASLSHAHLGGYSLADTSAFGDPAISYGTPAFGQDFPFVLPDDLVRVTATGSGGLAPRVLQAVGNSYAHPNIPADAAYKTWARQFRTGTSATNVTFADHSYLANKALWDEFFFSSIIPQPSKVPLFESENRTAQEVAEDFFFDRGHLPNRRVRPYMVGMDDSKFGALFSEKDLFTGGLADKIAAHLMVEGAFNINSTSVEAWKSVFSSLKGKPVAILKDGQPAEAQTDGTSFGPGSLPNAEPVETAEIIKSNNPPRQWLSGRELTDGEIGELAEAMVKQVRLRGPFLSLSEFVNRRLDGSNEELALKGALQAALDDEEVSINAEFRKDARKLDAETAGIPFAFPAAAKGPIAYGSAPYVDQADILRNFAAQLTPRGDTFVIRAYGDSLDPAGKVLARAWCEAVVQRVPEYLDPTDEDHVKTELLQSEANREFGRKFQIVSFRWLNPGEV